MDEEDREIRYSLRFTELLDGDCNFLLDQDKSKAC